MRYTLLEPGQVANLLAKSFMAERVTTSDGIATYQNEDDGVEVKVKEDAIIMTKGSEGPPMRLWTLSLRWRPITTQFGDRHTVDAWFYGDATTEEERRRLVQFDKDFGWILIEGLEAMVAFDDEHLSAVTDIVDAISANRALSYRAARERSLGAQVIPGRH